VRLPSRDVLIRLAAVLGTSTEDLLRQAGYLNFTGVAEARATYHGSSESVAELYRELERYPVELQRFVVKELLPLLAALWMKRGAGER
jgi:hypothetical protein